MSKASNYIDVNLRITNNQSLSNKQQDFIKEQTLAKLYKSDDNVRLIYKSTDDDGIEVNSSLKIDFVNKSIEVRRYTKQGLSIEFSEGKTHRTYYNTDYGRLELIYDTKKIKWPNYSHKNRDSYEVTIVYDLIFLDQEPVSNSVAIRYKEI